MRWFDRKIDEFIRRIRDSRTPMLVDGDHPEGPIYYRYFVWPRNRWFNCYLHNFLRDDAQDPHDHRMLNISFPLQGEYFEDTFDSRPRLGQPYPTISRRLIREHSLRFRFPWTPHRVVLKRNDAGKPITMWSLFIGFPQIREWGFWKNFDGRCLWVWWEVYDESRTRHYKASLEKAPAE